MEPEVLQSVLEESGIQVDMKNLQNPTEEFMIYLITEYLSKYHLDVNQIAKPTLEQLECLLSPDSPWEVIKVINLFSALSSFCNEIFLVDLCLTDITSPGPKRARRQIKILFNFFAYYKNKMVEHETSFEELDNRQREIDDMIENKSLSIAKIGATIDERESKIEYKQMLQKEIENLQKHIENNNKKKQELENQVGEIMTRHQDKHKHFTDLKAKAIQLHKITVELQSKIVKSPEEYASRSSELKKVIEMKKEERQELNDSIQKKKLQIKKNESAQELVKDLNDKFQINSKDTYKQLKEATENLKLVEKKLNTLNHDIQRWSSIEKQNSTDHSTDNDYESHKQLLFELDNQLSDKERECSSQKKMLERVKLELNGKKSILEHELSNIKATENDGIKKLREFKNYFRKKILEEMNLREQIMEKVFGSNHEKL
ncbi:kinetochore protein Nuf2-A-like [Trichogramma pretiosum]|uniref:kinetochore protein Nuf2-A-like n=1 Tax=Trichogramma pretiosum TaxID=7493 RepID=UPI000C71A063|nr:kinetochore protein Nuf2-A-like [Trichogramma pretiosum]